MYQSVRSLTTAAALGLLATTALGAQEPAHAHHQAAGQVVVGEVGTVVFSNSGAAAAQPAFRRGVALMHSFEYPHAAEAFREAQRLDPGFALAYWGEAMTHNHPIWMRQDRAAARAILERLGPTPETRQARAPTKRERDYLATLEILYGEGRKEARDSAYARAMGRLAAEYPDDPEAAAFHALALLGTAHQGRDIPTYMRAAAIVEEVYRDHPQHPGAAHYLIHSYDDPVHAPLGLRAARAYSKIAPAAAHAQHMTSHIFVATGMWDEVVAANETAVEVLNEQRAASGQPPTSCGHYAEWQHYGYLQQGRYREARSLLERCHTEALSLDDRRQVGSFLSMRARQLLDTEEWTSGVLQLTVPLGDVAARRFSHDFVTTFAALRRGDLATARPLAAGVAEARRTAAAHASADDLLMQRMLGAMQVMEQELQAMLLLADGKREEGVALLRRAAEMEEALPFEFGPPFVDKPAHELLGEVLLELGRPAEARVAFEGALARAPRRVSSLLGLARAAEQAGDHTRAEEAFAAVRAIRHRADPGLAAR